MKRNILALICHVLVLAVLVTAFGCISLQRNEFQSREKFSGELERGVTLRVLENDTAKEKGYFQELLDAFNAAYAQYGIVAVDANMDQYTDLEQDGPYGYGPDVLYQANDALMKYTDGKHILPLPVEKLNCYDQISKQAWDAYTAEYGGESYIFGVPVNIQGPLLYYRKDLLPDDWQTEWDADQNGVPDMTEYWTELYAYSRQIKDESGGTRFGYMKSLFDTYFSSGYLFTYGAYVFGNGGTDATDIGFSAGDSYKGAFILRQLASAMNQDCIDDTITVNAYSMLGNGTYFATMTTPDVYTLFLDELAKSYMRTEKLSEEEAVGKARENLVVTDIPKLPASGNLEDRDGEMVDRIMMGGINGYAISTYTKAPNAALAFVDFATSYEMISRRNVLLGIAPARADVAAQVGGLSETINNNLMAGRIAVMPSTRAVAQIWTPAQTFFSDLAKDPFREPAEQKYLTDAALRKGLEKVDEQIYSAIHTLN